MLTFHYYPHANPRSIVNCKIPKPFQILFDSLSRSIFSASCFWKVVYKCNVFEVAAVAAVAPQTGRGLSLLQPGASQCVHAASRTSMRAMKTCQGTRNHRTFLIVCTCGNKRKVTLMFKVGLQGTINAAVP